MPIVFCWSETKNSECVIIEFNWIRLQNQIRLNSIMTHIFVTKFWLFQGFESLYFSLFVLVEENSHTVLYCTSPNRHRTDSNCSWKVTGILGKLPSPPPSPNWAAFPGNAMDYSIWKQELSEVEYCTILRYLKHLLFIDSSLKLYASETDHLTCWNWTKSPKSMNCILACHESANLHHWVRIVPVN